MDSAVTGIWKHQEHRRGRPLCPHTCGPWNPEGNGGDDQQMAQAGRPRNGHLHPLGILDLDSEGPYLLKVSFLPGSS